MDIPVEIIITNNIRNICSAVCYQSDTEWKYNYFFPSTSSFPDGIFNNTQGSTRGWKENNKRLTDEEARN
jgi:hypothetical protein